MYKNLKWCCTKQIKPMYDNIKYKDYFEPIKKYSKENDNIFDDIIKKNNINDTVIQYYIKSSTNISIIIVYPNALKDIKLVEKLIKKLEENGDIHYIKDIEIDYFMAYNMSYQLYSTEERMKNNSSIQYKIERLGFINNNTVNTIKIIVYTLTNNKKQINGKSAKFKMELRDIFLQEEIKITKYTSEQDAYPRGYDYLHISDDNNQSYEYAGMFFHNNSLKFLKRQKTWRLLNMYKTQKLMNLTKNFFYDYSLNEFEKLMIFSSGVLFTYGIREANDIDCILLENNVIKANNIKKFLNKNIDITYKGTNEYNQHWEDELNKRAKMYNAKNYKELITNPKYYYYFMGFKIIRLKFELMLRFKRNRPAQFTDLLVIRQMFNFGYTLKIPEKNITFNEKTMKNKEMIVNKNKYLNTIKWYLEKRYYISITKEQIKQWINMNFNEELNDDPNEYYSDLNGELNDNPNEYYSDLNGGAIKNSINFIKGENDSDNIYIYPTQIEILKKGYEPNIIIYSSDKPYLYPGENFEFDAVVNSCSIKKNNIKPKQNALRIASFNLHNFVSRCNQGIAPLFGTALNPFNKSKDINKFIELFKQVNADIYCFQELVPITKQEIKKDITDLDYIRNNFNFKYFNKLMEKLGYKYKIIGPTQHGKFHDLESRTYYYLANGIYSKIKLHNSEIYNFNYLNRNIITAEVIFNNKTIRIFNTHLDYYKTSYIIEQFKDLQILIDYFKNNNSIICGDFNINIFKKNWKEKTEYIRNNYINTNKCSSPTNFYQQDQTDFILLLKNSNISIINSLIVLTNISDHNMIFSDFL